MNTKGEKHMSTVDNKALVQQWVDQVLNTRDVSDQSPAYQLVAPEARMFSGAFDVLALL
jgi:hypothetical protein